MGSNTRTHLIRDQFISSHPNCDLRRHLDSVPPDTPIRDIIDRCRMWESHSDTDDRRVVKPTPEKARPVYAVSKPTLMPTEQVIAAVTGPSVGLADLEAMLKHLLPAVSAQALPPHSVSIDIEAILKRLLPGTLTQAPQPRPETTRRDWSTVLYFSCGKYGQGVGRCPQLDMKSPFMLPGWSAEKMGDYYAMISQRLAATRLRAGNGN